MQYVLKSGAIIEIDPEDLFKVMKHNWRVDEKGYVVTNSSRKDNPKRNRIFLHRYLTDCPEGMVVDHEDGNPLNNKRKNLRICTHAQNSRNRKINKKGTSKFKGVSFNKRDKRWVSVIGFENKTISLGYFKEEKDAALAYNRKAVELFGEFACLNPVEDDGKEILNVRHERMKNKKYAGVSQKGKKFESKIFFQKKCFYLGMFETPEGAALAYNKKALELLGDKAKLNIIEGGIQNG